MSENADTLTSDVKPLGMGASSALQGSTTKNRAEIALELLEKMGTVTNGYIAHTKILPTLTFRNAISEAKALLPVGYKIVANIKGRVWEKHSYSLVRTGELF